MMKSYGSICFQFLVGDEFVCIANCIHFNVFFLQGEKVAFATAAKIRVTIIVL